MGTKKKDKDKDYSNSHSHKKKRKHADETEEERIERKRRKKAKKEKRRRKSYSGDENDLDVVDDAPKDTRDSFDDYSLNDLNGSQSKIVTTVTKQEVNFGSSHYEGDWPNEKDSSYAAEPEIAHEGVSGGGELALSIDETNKLRAKLGLRPLDVPTGDATEKPKKESLKDDIHLPAINLSEKKKSEILKEKLQAIKEKRQINKKLNKIKTLGESDEEDDSAAAWVEKIRKQQVERQMAAKRAKLLEEMDNEFGIGDLVEADFAAEKQKVQNQAYTAQHLRGLAVEHSKEAFGEGQEVILTLKDRAVLEEDDDLLVNINILDDELAKKNVDLRKKRPDYKPYDEGNYDEFGMFQKKNLLDKYDETIEGEKKSKFTLGIGGGADTSKERTMEAIRSDLRKQAQTLQQPQLKLTNEYYTHEEMIAFRKPRKKMRRIRKERKSSVLTSDDLIALAPSSSDLGSRSQEWSRGEQVIPGLDNIPGLGDDEANDSYLMDIDTKLEALDESDMLGPDEDLSGIPVEEDEAENELQLALHKARKVKQLEKPASAKLEDLADNLLSKREASSSASTATGNILLNSTSEFCRTLGDIPTYGQAGNRDDDPDELKDFEMELFEKRKRQLEDGDVKATGWEEVEIDSKPAEIKKSDAHVLDDEPVVAGGVAAALELASKKGYLEATLTKNLGVTKLHHLEAENYTIEEKSAYDIEDKYTRRDRYSAGPLMDFREKDSYKPDVRLTYIDDTGRDLAPKEAFRFLSHKFHGKGSGKNKTEKRAKKIEEETLMRKMSSTDTPLNTVSMLQEKQKATRSPFIVLSGSSKGATQNTIAKS